MEDKLVRLQIARTGTFGADGRSISLQDLQDVLDTFDGKAPVSLGHYAARQDWMPSWGNVENLMLERDGEGGGTLVADISIRDVLWDAIRSGFYPGWSVSIPVNPDGRHYLHHLAFLGAMPPAIRDLKIIQTADGQVPDDAVRSDGGKEFQPEVSAIYSYADFPESGKAHEVKKEGSEKTEEDTADVEEGDTESPGEETKDTKKAEAEPEKGDSEPEAIGKARRIYAAGVRASLDRAMEGKVPPAVRKKVHEFADEAVVSWDFRDDAEEPRIITLFKEILESIGKMPSIGRMDFSDTGVGGDATKANPADLARKF